MHPGVIILTEKKWANELICVKRKNIVSSGTEPFLTMLLSWIKCQMLKESMIKM